MPNFARSSAPLGLAAVAAAALIAGCGSSSSDATGSTAAAAPAATAAAPATAAAAPSTTAAASGAVTATGGAVTVDASEFKFRPTAITAKAGKLKVTLDNKGGATHEFVLLKTTQAAGALKVTGQSVSESDSVGEISETDGGSEKTHVFDLKPGKYVYVCNVPGHYMDGMRGTLTVQ